MQQRFQDAFLRALRLACRPDLWCADGLGHAVEDHDALTAAVRRESFNSAREAAVDVLPVVGRSLRSKKGASQCLGYIPDVFLQDYSF
jgi:hypothetical protein